MRTGHWSVSGGFRGSGQWVGGGGGSGGRGGQSERLWVIGW